MTPQALIQRWEWHRGVFFTYANNSSEILHQMNNGSKWVRIVDKTRGKTCHDTVPFRTIQSWLVSSKILFWHAWVGNNIQHCGMPITPLPPPPPPPPIEATWKNLIIMNYYINYNFRIRYSTIIFAWPVYWPPCCAHWLGGFIMQPMATRWQVSRWHASVSRAFMQYVHRLTLCVLYT